jgi:hypothetical protein
MGQPLPKSAVRIRSDYQPGRAPAYVAKWEKWANDAPDDIAALIQLTYFQALQIRAIKLVLVWTLIIVPIILFIGFLVLGQAFDPPVSRY